MVLNYHVVSVKAMANKKQAFDETRTQKPRRKRKTGTERRGTFGINFMKLTTLIFDVDGTLADTERDGHRVAYNQAFVAAGLDWEWSPGLYGELLQVTGGKERMRFYVERYRHDFQNRPDLDRFIADLYVTKTCFFADLVNARGIPLRPGVSRLLHEARASGLRLAIATTTSPHNVNALLESNLGAASRDWFACIGAGDIVSNKKPSPDIYLYVIERLGIGPGECIGFEDSAIGVRAARAAGLPVLVTTNDYTQNQDFTGAQLVVDHLGEPDRPFTVLAGNARGANLVDVALLRAITQNL
ncbi:Protein CbbY, chromosomal [Gammaproteobacteria bacterium]